MIDVLEKQFGSGVVVILQNAREAAGAASGKALVKLKDKDNEVKKTLSSTSKWGFRKYALVSFDPTKKIVFKLISNIIRMEAKKEVMRNHHFLIGFYKGYFRQVYGKTTTCRETLCMNFGESHCEFEITMT